MKMSGINNNIKLSLYIALIVIVCKSLTSQGLSDLKKMDYHGENNEKKIEMSGASFLTKSTTPEINKEFSLYSLNSKWYILSLHDSYFYSTNAQKEIISSPVSKVFDLKYNGATSFLLSNLITRFQLHESFLQTVS
jgi:hypothetical protein